MGPELCLVEVSGCEVASGTEVLEPILASVRGGVSNRLSCSLASTWPTLNLFLTGDQYSSIPPLGNAVLGGAIAELGEPMQLLVLLQPLEVIAVRNALNQQTYEQLVAGHGEHVVGQFEPCAPAANPYIDGMREFAESAPGLVLESMREGLGALQLFYDGVRAEEGYGVAKRLYGHF